MIASREILVTGIVQGVGFRPFVYRIANRNGVTGTVCNTSEGVKITVEGDSADLNDFLHAFENELPPLAVVTSMKITERTPTGIEGFRILPSTDDTAHEALVPPDVSVCANCLAELFDPSNRRYQYAFINCTDCGPRYTIVDDVPYDRTQTSMIDFPMCERCREEYENPADRRFHAQATCCKQCGPALKLYDRHRNAIDATDPIAAAREHLKQGRIVAVKGVGGFHLAVDACNDTAVELLRTRKGRGFKPFALMADSIDKVRRLCEVSDAEEEMLASSIRPILILRKRQDNGIASGVAPYNNYFGVMLPYTPLHRLLLGDSFNALVMTSGNLSDEPIVTSDDEAFQHLGTVADYILTHNRRILHRADDSILKLTGRRRQMLRRSRGFVPRPITTAEEMIPMLACGGLMKNTIALTRGRDIFVSQHMGDIDTQEGFEFFEDTITHLCRLLGVKPEVIVHDLHPDYLTTHYAQASAVGRKIGVQHHIAHIAACQLEHGITDRDVIGIALDGTGYGLDGNIWGGEVLVGRPPEYRRAAHLEYTPMPGGELAIHQPWRMAASHLLQALGSYRDLPLQFIKQHESMLEGIDTMIERRLRSPLTSSCGRLFDAVAAMLGLIDTGTFEGEPAVRLEMAATPYDGAKPYRWELLHEHDAMIISPRPIIRGIIDDILAKRPAGVISWRFHITLVELLGEVAVRLRGEHGIDSVALGGGVFLNTILATHLPAKLESLGFSVFMPEEVPPGDGGVSLGQIAVAQAIMAQGADN